MDIYQLEFIANLKRYRGEKKFSQAQLAEACGVATGTIGNIECGVAKPSFDLLIKIANVLNIHPSKLFSQVDEEPIINNENDEHKMLLQIHELLEKHFMK